MLEFLLANLDDAYSRKGWHGTSLRGALRGVTVQEALRRPAKGRHNVWELTAHAAYWKYAARNRLTKGQRGSFVLKGSNWFASPTRADDALWRALVKVLEDEHRLLRAAVASMSDADLRDAKKLRLVYGVAAHDVYHTGQIQLVKRMARD